MIFTGEELNKREGAKNWPEAGDILQFSGVPEFYYPMFTNMKDEANQNLVLGNSYRVEKSEVYSSWCAVWLEGIEGYYNLRFFSWN